MIRLACLGLAALLLASCAAPPPPRAAAPELFVVLPGPGGKVGSIVVTRGSDSRVIDTAFGAQKINPDGQVVAASMTRDQVHEIFADTVDALPGKPATFMLYFLEGRDALTPESTLELDKVFTELKRRPLPDIQVIGHTDSVGGLNYNDKLSLARAERMREMMVTMGIPAERITAAGRGKRELLVPTEDNVAEPRNRRVEISVR